MSQETSDVSSISFSIIAAFTSCRDVLRKIRARRHRKAGQQQPGLSKDELSLNQSLREGPREIEACYAAGLQRVGQPFNAGDAHARSELTSILLRLNAGLVDIISSFINTKDPSKIKLDYQALTTMSDVSRHQARVTLGSLAQRLSVASTLHLAATSPMIKQCNDARTRVKPHGDSKKPPYKRHKSIPEGKYIAISKRKNETQIAFVRPRPDNKRKVSSESANATKRKAAAKTTNNERPSPAPVTSIPVSPDVGQELRQSEWQTKTPPGGSRDNVQAKPTIGSAEKNPLPIRSSNPQQPWLASLHPQIDQQSHATHPSPLAQISANQETSARRRAAANTATMYTYVSDSTKLGEIPLHRWTIPFDFKEAERLNAEVETANWVAMQQAAKAKKGPGLLKRLFRKS